jgi:hypothetical protein
MAKETLLRTDLTAGSALSLSHALRDDEGNVVVLFIRAKTLNLVHDGAQ